MTDFNPTPDVPTVFEDVTDKFYVPRAHVFDKRDIAAVNAALRTRRPLLVRGEPGVGKSQLALAAAVVLKRAYVQHVVNALTEPNDLLWNEDAVRRLADAQVIGALGHADALKHSNPENQSTRWAVKEEVDTLRKNIGRKNYLQPGPVWWAFNWSDARRQAEHAGIAEPVNPTKECSQETGVVVLIDEIDKAGSEVPNSLLEAFGSRQFAVPERAKPVTVEVGRWPLVIITTNEERVLPNAFLRRCVVHDIKLPDHRTGLKEYLVTRAEAHFGEDEDKTGLYERAAKLTIEDREKAIRNHWEPLPGLAEYLDLLRAVDEMPGVDHKRRSDELDNLKDFFLKKHPDSRKGD